MAITFDESSLLDVYYSAKAEGGAEWATALIRAGEGGAISSRAETREDYISRYEIFFGDLEFERQQQLRSFHILRKGMARGFRFLAPDDHLLTDEQAGVLNDETGEIEVGVSDGAIDTVYAIKHYEDEENEYTRRIIKLSPVDNLTVTVYDDEDAVYSVFEFVNLDGTWYETRERNILDPENWTCTVDFTTGEISFSHDLTTGYYVKVTGTYHLPAAFTEDKPNFSVDEAAISELRIGIEELLPVELGIT
jgi:uncharacterized protein (TIGR02217 family)